MWENDANKNGGKGNTWLKKGLGPRCYETHILAVLEQLMVVGLWSCGLRPVSGKHSFHIE